MIVLWRKLFIQKSFLKNGMTLRNPKKNLRKESWQRTSGTTKWDKLGQVESWDKWDKEKGVFRSEWDKWNKEKGVFRSSWDKWDRDKGLSTWTIPLVPNGTTRPWSFYWKLIVVMYVSFIGLRLTKTSLTLINRTRLMTKRIPGWFLSERQKNFLF